MRLTKIYTRTGDQGFTRLNNKLLAKDDLLIEALGTIDELNAFIGFLVCQSFKTEVIKEQLLEIQNDLFDMGGELHIPEHPAITAQKITDLENKLDAWNEILPPLQEFVLPGGNTASAAAHLARTVCRRAERTIVRLHRQTPLTNTEILKYLNRLSDLLFVIARILARENNDNELLWKHE